VSHVGPVTGVAFTPDDKYIVYSSGQNVNIYSVEEDKDVGRRAIFERNRVHGIQCKCYVGSILIVVDKLPDDIAVILWGATSFTYFLKLGSFLSPTNHTPTSEIKSHDWILDARFLTQETILLVTAHNSLLVFDTTTDSFRGQLKCKEQSLLYAAQLFLSPNTDRKSPDILVASGTVFNEIQLWWPPSSQTQASAVIPISRRLQGHEGCIFSLRFNAAGTLLASCSDDRTTRIWEVETGSQLAIGFAHIARVWDVRFVHQNTYSDDNDIYLLSSSEDTTALLWNFSKSNKKLKVQERYQGHRGKHVWSQAVSSDGTKAVTGGNDGGVNIWDIAAWRDRLENDGNGVYWKELSPAVIINGKEKRDPIKGYRCLDEERLLITTGSGYIRGIPVLTEDVYICIICREERGL
jgi:WD repeat-containing protein 6